MSSEIHNNLCEICGKKAGAGILDNYDNNDSNEDNNQIRIRYSCHDHYLQVYKKIKEERKNKK
ncbi:MAG: hypothetical protein ACRD6U_06370 [Nitrososphaeraceae archaeon]|jgi:hypothetical protein